MQSCAWHGRMVGRQSPVWGSAAVEQSKQCTLHRLAWHRSAVACGVWAAATTIMSHHCRDPYSIFDTLVADKHIANLALFVRLQVPWAKPTSSVESGFVADASRVANVPHMLFQELAAGGRELL